MPDEPEGRQSLIDWEVSTIRVTAFAGADLDVHPEAGSWWTQVVESDAEESRSRPGVGEIQESGIFEGKRLVLDIKPGRVDWHLSALPGLPDEQPEIVPTIGPLNDVLTSFTRLTDRWLGICPPLTRMAFGAVLVKPVTDRETGYSTIDELLPKVDIDPENSFDFLYKINRPRTSMSGISGLILNRLSTWSVLATFLLQVGAGSGGGGVIRDAQQPRFFCRLELDMSTDTNFQEGFSGENTRVVFRELVELGREIAEGGDLP